MVFCSNCGGEISPVAKFCASCGAANVALEPTDAYAAVPTAEFVQFGLSTGNGKLNVAKIVEAVTVFDGDAPPRPPTADQSVDRSNLPSPRLGLVKQGSNHALHFINASSLHQGKPAPATIRTGGGLKRCYADVRRFKDSGHRYTEACVAPGGENTVIHLQLVNGKFLKVVGTELVLDVSFWNFEVGNSVNYVSTDGNSYIGGGGRDWSVNADGT